MSKETGRRARGAPKRVNRKRRQWVYGISLATLPVLTAYGILSEEMALLYGTLLGTILVPWLALNESAHAEDEEHRAYNEGVTEGVGKIDGVQVRNETEH